MKTLSKRINKIILALLTSSAINLEAAFENVSSGARPAGLGNAFTAVGDDVHALYFNPGSLGTLSGAEFASMYSKLFMGLSDNSDIGISLLGYGHPLGPKGRWGQMGLGLWRLKLDSLFTEQYMALGYGKRLGKVFSGPFHAGLSLKLLERSYGSTPEIKNAISLSGQSLGKPDPVLAAKNSKSAIGVDLGFLYRWQHRYNIGFALQNVNEPNLGLGANDRDAVPLTMRTGVAIDFSRSMLAFDFIRQATIPGRFDHRLALGAERWWLVGSRDVITARAGFSYGDRNLRKLALGLGYQFHRLAFNYAFQMPLAGVQKTDGNHQVAFNIRFGALPFKDDEEKLLQEERQARNKAEKNLEEAERLRFEAEKKLRELQDAVKAGDADRQRRELESEAQAARLREQKARESLEKAFNLSISYYRRQKTSGAATGELIKILEKIIANYDGKGLQLTTIQEELETLRANIKKAEQDFKFSWEYYQKLREQDVAVDTRIELLERILKKFEGSGVNLGEIREELKKLK